MNQKLGWCLSRKLLALSLPLLAVDDALAEPFVRKQLLICSSINAADERLACFDEYTARYLQAAQDLEEAQRNSAGGTEFPEGFDKTYNEPSLDNRAIAESGFGYAPVKQITAISAKVVGVQTNSTNSVFLLDNEQRWQQKDGRRHRIREGQEVIIEEGALGAFYLKKPSAKRRVRVQRVE